MDHKWLADFITLARERSFSRAAALRHVTQPQFSRRIRALELWIGAELVDRGAQPLALTEAGESLLPVARRAASGLDDARARIRHAAEGGGGEWVTLATGRTLARTAVPGWFADARARLGRDLRLRIVTGSMQEGAQALEQGVADFLLSFTHPRLPLALDERAFESRAIGDDELVAVSAPQPGSVRGVPRHALPGTAASPVPVLGYAPSLALAQILEDALTRDRRELHRRVVIECDFAEALHEQALRGVGVAWLPRALVAADLAAGRLVAADPDVPDGAGGGVGHRFEVRLYRPRAPRSAWVDRVWAASGGD